MTFVGDSATSLASVVYNSSEAVWNPHTAITIFIGGYPTMCIVCDLLSTVIPPMPDPLEDCRRPNCFPLLRPPAPMVRAEPSQAIRKEAEDNA